MAVPDLSQLLETKWIVSAASFVVGGLLTNLVGALRGRLRVLEYSVTHERVAMAGQDAVFGTVEVTWEGQKMSNLSINRVVLVNNTGKDLTNLKLKAFAGVGTRLLTQYIGVIGSPDALKFTDEFTASLTPPHGQPPSDQQRELFYRERQYSIPVLNRGQQVQLKYLTTATQGGGVPSVWLDLPHVGVKLVHRAVVPLVHGVPLRLALAIGLVASVVIYGLCVAFVDQPWLAGGISLLVGLAAQSVGALLFKGYRGAAALVLR